MYDKLILYYGEYYSSENTKNKYALLSSSVCIELMSRKSLDWEKEGYPKLESLPEEKKKELWGIAGKYQSDKEKRILAFRAVYGLMLLTSE